MTFQRKGNRDREEKAIEWLTTEGGMEINRNVNGAAFQEAAKPIWATFIEETGTL
ncbi:hypothetical protein Q5Y75_16930 [Ruegeria sp. 2205SS24-7]|uniref:hypothetical protein n=1 Tax=Ruegeria discodermiae TaxID=3064389 RepID=UPI0027404013|nr:hypothetical protein [Ruegeria sp. 2205SS24-7]MDP5218907.1 hypothetical protein [Ruegeria sp. 2205SS24-7]